MAQSSSPAALAVIGEKSLDQSWKVIGAGGFGQVFKARHLQWRWDVAIKLLCLDNGSFSDKDLLREAELMRRAESPYVMRVLGVFRGCRPSSTFVHVGLVMELMERGSLESLQNKLNQLPPSSLVFRLAHQVALGMNYLHSLSPPIIHRDLKPGNVLLDTGLNVKITDFGLAKFVNNVTSTRVKGAGTPFFMPPEAFSPLYTSACSFDVYSYAILLWSLLNTGHSDAQFDVLRGERPPLDVAKGMKAPGLKKLVELMESCWHQNHNRRPGFPVCTAVTEGLYEEHKSGINAAVYHVQKKLDPEGSMQDAQSAQQMHEKLKKLRLEPFKPAGDALNRAVSPRPAVYPGCTNRKELLKHSSPLSLDPNTANKWLILSENNMKVTYTPQRQRYADHPERFTLYAQVLSRESVSDGYFEVEGSGEYVYIAVSYKDIVRAGGSSGFGCNDQSWVLLCSGPDDAKRYRFIHNSIDTVLSVPVSSTRRNRLGVYVDHRRGILCFYHVDGNTMRLLHTERTTFTRPLYAGIGFGWVVDKATAEVCKIW